MAVFAFMIEIFLKNALVTMEKETHHSEKAMHSQLIILLQKVLQNDQFYNFPKVRE